MQSEDLSRDWRQRHVTAVASLYLGFFGFDRFYRHHIGWGIIKLFTFGGFFVWWAIDAAYYAYQAGKLESAASSAAWRRPHIVMLISWLYGYLGMDRFYQQQVGWGILKLLTFGGFFIWWLIDAIYYTTRAGRT